MARYKPEGFTKRFVQRTRMLRESAGFSSHSQMAESLGIPAKTYHKYETRTCMPHHLVPRFLKITGGKYEMLFGPLGGAGGLGADPKPPTAKVV